MGEVAIFLVSLVPVLLIGSVLVDVLLRTAPRRGKRPDLGTTRAMRPAAPGHRVCVVTDDGRRLAGTAWSVARQMGTWTSSEAAARRRLDALEAQGLIHSRVDDAPTHAVARRCADR